MTRLRVCFVLLAFLLAAGSRPAKSDTIYTYTGQPFTIVSAPYTMNDYVSAVMTTQTPLPQNTPLSPVFVNSLTLSDGVQTLIIDPSLNTLLQVGTDGSGNIDSWDILLGYSASYLISTQKTTNVTADLGSLDSVRQADNSGTPGVWQVSAVSPEPASVGLVAAGVISLIAAGIRSRAEKSSSSMFCSNSLSS